MGKLSNLPSDILLDIMIRLPTETVLECKLVCKPWRNLVSKPSFSQMHLTHHLNHQDPAGKLTFLLSTPQQFHCFEYNENADNDEATHRITRININPLFENSSIIGSCNGLICLSAYYHVTSPCDHQPAYICNPITKEYIILPRIKRVRNPGDSQAYSGFGYIRETNEYKVVRIDKGRGGSGGPGNPSFHSVEVYTLGSGNGWRNVGESCVFYFDNYYGVFARETIYWITGHGQIVAFNLADEKFVEHPTLPSLSPVDNRGYFDVGVLGGSLWCSITLCVPERIDIWLIKKNGDQYVMEQKEYLSFTWDEKFIIKKPLALMKSGEVLLFSSPHLYSYDIESSCLKMLVTFPQNVYQLIPHMNTLISLKALGEKDTITME